MKKTCIRILTGCVLCVVIVSAAGAQPLATVEGSPAGVEWRPTVLEVGLVLIVSGPDGFYSRQETAPGVSPRFSVFDELGALRPNGIYVWELRPVVRLDTEVAAELSASRESGDGAVLAKLARRAPERGAASGSFSILDGEVFAGGLEEPAPAAPQGENRLSTKVVLTNANGVIRNALCVGADCPDAPAFGDSSVLMMENNNRIKFGDTSVSPFPNNDWEIEANSSLSGGQSYLGFNDCGPNDNDGDCATDLVFAVEAGARASALYVESDGDVGLGTSSPVLDLHIVTGNTPALRLEQDASSGFTAQTWDVAGNEASFFVRDVTSGSTLPFRIRPGASSSSLVVDTTGAVGIGILTAAQDLHVTDRGDANTNTAVRLSTASHAWDFAVIESNGNFRVSKDGTGFNEFDMTPTGNLTIRGQLFTSGSCSIGCDRVFSPDYELESIEEHAAAMFANSHLPAVGPTAEDGPFNLSAKTLGMLNELEKAHIYITQLNEQHQAEKQALEERLGHLEAQLQAVLDGRD
jgi:hypothetical protein